METITEDKNREVQESNSDSSASKEKVFLLNNDNCIEQTSLSNVFVKSFEAHNITKLVEANEFLKPRGGALNDIKVEEPIEYFQLLANENVLTKILEGTNKNLEKWVNECEGIDSETEAISLNELKTFIGLLLHMGTIQLNRMVDYWRVDSLFNISCYPLHMSRNRFLIILKSLQFYDQSQSLINIKSFLDHFNDTMDVIYNPGKDLTLREPLVYTNGCLRKKHIQGKLVYSTVFHSLTDVNGVTLHCLLTVEKDVCDEMVLTLVNTKLNKEHCVYLCPLYCTETIGDKLLENGTKCVGVLTNSIPPPRHQWVDSNEDTVSNRDTKVTTVKWKQTPRDIVFFTSETDHKELRTRYNSLMTEDEHYDQLLSYYTCDRRPMQMEKKIGIHVIQLMLINSFYIYSARSDSNMTLYDFRLSVIRNLLSSTNPNFERLNPQAHFPARLKADEKGKAKRKKCRLCYQNGKRRDSLHYCPTCPQMPGLCLDNCFLAYHQLLSTHC